MKAGLSALCIGGLFGAGLGISGMGQPQRIVGFLDFLQYFALRAPSVAGKAGSSDGAWDPALLLVMAGAVGVHFVAQRIARKRAAPLFVPDWPTYAFTRIDARLLAGAALFGLGWGLTGFCPAPGILSAAAGVREGLVFVPAMLAGMALFHGLERIRARAVTDETGAARRA
ncbi:MAG TPA: DUF6691 family protein [Myxococcales bacterium]|nr:DUF6691 family protein [Myxococcales bacterium]